MCDTHWSVRQRRVRSVAVTLLIVLLAPATVSAGGFTLRGQVSRVIDGDTLQVTLLNGKSERVRLIGIDTPESGVCYASNATAAARTFAAGKKVTLRGDATQDTRDRYGRLLAYVWLPGGKDLGFKLIAGGFGKVYIYNDPFQRLSAYRKAEGSAKGKGVWKCGTSKPKPAPSGGSTCAAGYSPCLPIVGDLDCGEISDSLKPIRVTGSDPYRLDADGDGYGCDAG